MWHAVVSAHRAEPAGESLPAGRSDARHPLAHVGDYRAVVFVTKNSRSGHKNVGSRFGHRGNIVDFDPAVDLDVDFEPAAFDLASHRAQLLQALGDEALPA